MYRRRRQSGSHLLIGIWHFVLDGAFIVYSSAVRTPPLLAMGFDIVIAELTNLRSALDWMRNRRLESRKATGDLLDSRRDTV